MGRRRSEGISIADDPALDDDIRRWYASIDLKCLADSLASKHGLHAESTGAVMMYLACRAVELQLR